VVPFDSCPSSLYTSITPSGSVPTMAEVHPAPAATDETSPAHGSILLTLQHDVSSIKRDLKDLRTIVESLVKEIKEMKRAKVETVGNCFPFRLASLPLSASPRSPSFSASVSKGSQSILLAIVTSFPDHRVHPPLYVMGRHAI